MRLLFVADGRSPTALNWMRYFVERGDEVYLASTFACQPDLKLNGLEIIPVAFSGLKSSSGQNPVGDGKPRGSSKLWGASALKLRTTVRQWLGPLTISRASDRLRGLIEQGPRFAGIVGVVQVDGGLGGWGLSPGQGRQQQDEKEWTHGPV